MTLGSDTHGVLMVDDWSKVVPHVDYTLRPVNAVVQHRWVVAEGIKCKRAR